MSDKIENTFSSDLRKALRPQTAQSTNGMRSRKTGAIPIIPAVRRYAYEKGITSDELIEVFPSKKNITKEDIDRYITRKSIFTKQQIESKTFDDLIVDKAAERAEHRKAIEEIKAQKAVKIKEHADESKEAVHISNPNLKLNIKPKDDELYNDLIDSKQQKKEEKPQQQAFKISPMALAFADMEGIDVGEVKADKGTEDEIALKDVKNWLNKNKMKSVDFQISPLAQEMAESAGIENFEVLEGTGRNGEITSLDVHKYLEDQAKEETAKKVSFNEPVQKKAPVLKEKKEERISGIAQKMIEEAGIDAEELLTGSGPKGQITSLDVYNWMKKNDASDIKQQDEKEPVEIVSAEKKQDDPIEWPVNVLSIEADITEIAHSIIKNNSLVDFVLIAVCRAVKKHPGINTKYQNDKFSVSQSVNINLTKISKAGEAAFVIKDCDRLRLKDLSRKENLKNTTELATFSITDLTETAVVNASLNLKEGCGTMLALCTPIKRLRMMNQFKNERIILPLSLTVDSRVGDIVLSAEFMKSLKGYLENFSL